MRKADAAAVYTVCHEGVIEGKSTPLRLMMERFYPKPKERPIHLELPDVHDAQSAAAALAKVLKAVTKSEITLSEAARLQQLVEKTRLAYEKAAIEKAWTGTRKDCESPAGVTEQPVGAQTESYSMDAYEDSQETVQVQPDMESPAMEPGLEANSEPHARVPQTASQIPAGSIEEPFGTVSNAMTDRRELSAKHTEPFTESSVPPDRDLMPWSETVNIVPQTFPPVIALRDHYYRMLEQNGNDEVAPETGDVTV